MVHLHSMIIDTSSRKITKFPSKVKKLVLPKFVCLLEQSGVREPDPNLPCSCLPVIDICVQLPRLLFEFIQTVQYLALFTLRLRRCDTTQCIDVLPQGLAQRQSNFQRYAELIVYSGWEGKCSRSFHISIWEE